MEGKTTMIKEDKEEEVKEKKEEEEEKKEKKVLEQSKKKKMMMIQDSMTLIIGIPKQLPVMILLLLKKMKILLKCSTSRRIGEETISEKQVEMVLVDSLEEGGQCYLQLHSK